MITISLPLLIWLLVAWIALALAFCIGWNGAVWNFRRGQRVMAKNYERLADKYEELAVLMDADPTRAGINVGKDWAVGEIENLCREIRASMKD